MNKKEKAASKRKMFFSLSSYLARNEQKKHAKAHRREEKRAAKLGQTHQH